MPAAQALASQSLGDSQHQPPGPDIHPAQPLGALSPDALVPNLPQSQARAASFCSLRLGIHRALRVLPAPSSCRRVHEARVRPMQQPGTGSRLRIARCLLLSQDSDRFAEMQSQAFFC